MSAKNPLLERGAPAPPLSGTLATGEAFDLDSLRPRTVLIEFHRGTW